MATPPTIRLLILEDVPEDAELEERVLRRSGMAVEIHRVSARQEFVTALDTFCPDLFLLDYKLPDIDGLTAVKLIRERDQEAPIVLVTGVLQDEAAIEVVKAGPNDYIRKDRMARLPVAVQTALAAAAARRERRDAMRAVEQSAHDFADLYNNAPCGYHSVDAELTIVSINNTELAWLGYARDELVGKKRVTDLLTPSSATRLKQQAFPCLLEAGEIQGFEAEMVRKDGTTFQVLMNSTCVTDPDRKFVRSRTTVQDISRLKAAEQREHQSAADFRNVLYSTQCAMIFLDRDLQTRFLTPLAGTLFGVAPGDVGLPLLRKLAGPGAAELAADARSVLQTATPSEREIPHQNGRQYICRMLPYRTQDNACEGIIITLVDESDRKREANRLLADKQHAEREVVTLRSVLDGMPEGLIVADKDGAIIEFNPAAQRIHGIRPVYLPMHDADAVPRTVEAWASGSAVCAADGATPLPFELNPLVRALRGEDTDAALLCVRQIGGFGCHVAVTGRPIRAADGSIAGGFVVLTDAGDQAQVADLLGGAESYARHLLEICSDALITVSKSGTIVDVNNVAEQLTGVSRECLVGSHFVEHFADPDDAGGAYEKVLAEGSLVDCRLMVRNASGPKDVLVNARTYCDERGDVVGAVAAVRELVKPDNGASLHSAMRRLRALLP